MARDKKTEAIFTTADDQMQGLWGLFRYLKAATDIVEPKFLLLSLPKDIFTLTHEWGRMYNPKEMADQVCNMREFLLCRQSLVSLVTICEAALLRLNQHLTNLGRCTRQQKHARLLMWAFPIIKNRPLASDKATARLPKTCGDLDNARRLRNCIVHCNGCFDEKMYFDQAIQDGWIIPQYEKDSRRATTAGEPIFLTTEGLEYFIHSHIEFLHILHNTIQRDEFGHSQPYNYSDEGKQIEWYRILSGRRDVKM